MRFKPQLTFIVDFIIILIVFDIFNDLCNAVGCNNVTMFHICYHYVKF